MTPTQLRKALGAPDWAVVVGIGAQDGDIVDMTDVTEWHEDDPAPRYEAGTLYADAIRGANVMRHRAYVRRLEDRYFKTGITRDAENVVAGRWSSAAR